MTCQVIGLPMIAPWVHRADSMEAMMTDKARGRGYIDVEMTIKDRARFKSCAAFSAPAVRAAVSDG